MYRYNKIDVNHIEEQETRFIEEETSLKGLLINILAIQVIFFFLAQTLSVFGSQILPNKSYLNIEDLRFFASNMWTIFIVILLTVPAYVVLKKIKRLPLYLMAAYPLVLLIFSFRSSTSSLVVLTLAMIALAITYTANFYKIKNA